MPTYHVDLTFVDAQRKSIAFKTEEEALNFVDFLKLPATRFVTVGINELANVNAMATVTWGQDEPLPGGYADF